MGKCAESRASRYCAGASAGEVLISPPGTPANPLTAISVAKSTDGGLTFGNPIVAVSKSAMTHFLDKDWMPADPTDANRIFVTYTDFDTTGDPPWANQNFLRDGRDPTCAGLQKTPRIRPRPRVVSIMLFSNCPRINI